jgi:PD-(D/E)XK nuclease superfamily
LIRLPADIDGRPTSRRLRRAAWVSSAGSWRYRRRRWWRTARRWRPVRVTIAARRRRSGWPAFHRPGAGARRPGRAGAVPVVGALRMTESLGLAAVAALLLVVVGRAIRWRRGLGEGRTVSLDQVVLTSVRLGLTGRPDRLIKADGSIIIEEWKSARRVHDSHRAQMGVYFLLVQEELGVRPPHGVGVDGASGARRGRGAAGVRVRGDPGLGHPAPQAGAAVLVAHPPVAGGRARAEVLHLQRGRRDAAVDAGPGGLRATPGGGVPYPSMLPKTPRNSCGCRTTHAPRPALRPESRDSRSVSGL